MTAKATRTVGVGLRGRSCDEPRQRHWALVMTADEYRRLATYKTFLQRRRDAADEYRREREECRKILEQSTAGWTNTLKSNHAEMMAARKHVANTILKEKEEKIRVMMEEKAEERKKNLDYCHRLAFFQRESVHHFNTKLLFSEVLRERNSQLVFNQYLRDVEAGQEAEYAAWLRRDVEAWQKEQEEKKRQQELDRRALLKTRCDEFAIIEARKRHEKREKEKELKEMTILKKEFDMLEALEKQKALEKKQELKQSFVEALEAAQHYRKVMEQEDDMTERVTAIYAAVKQKIADTRLRKQKEMNDAQQKQRERIQKIIASKSAAQDVKEAVRFKKAQEEIAARQAKLDLEQKERHERRCREVRETEEKRQKDEEEQRRREREVCKWEMLENYERTRKYQKQDELERQRKELERRKTIKTLDEGTAQRKQKERSLEKDEQRLDKMLLDRQRKQDEEYLSYTAEEIEDSAKKLRPLLPLKRAVEEYKKKNRLVNPRRHDPMMKDNIPFGPKHHEDECGKYPCKCAAD